MEQYVDYIKRQHDSAERLKQQFPDELIESPKQSLWMHTGIDRYERPNELAHLVLFVGIAAVIILTAIFWKA